MKKNDRGMTELLSLLKAHPDLIRDLVFDPNSIIRVLRSRSARRLVRGRDVQEFLTRMAAPEDGYPISQCYGATKALCGKGTAACVGNTKPSPVCVGNTKASPICVGNTKPSPA
jgi:hypothetical protein